MRGNIWEQEVILRKQTVGSTHIIFCSLHASSSAGLINTTLPDPALADEQHSCAPMATAQTERFLWNSVTLGNTLHGGGRGHLNDLPVQEKAGSTVQVAGGHPPIAMVGRPYGTWLEDFLEVTGGTPPYRWTLVRGTLPHGLRQRWTGSIGGTPKIDGTFRFTVQATDADNNQSGEQDLTLTVSPKLTIRSDVSLWNDIMEPPPYFIAELHAEGGSPPYKWEAEWEPNAKSSLADSIALEPTTGRLTWTQGAKSLGKRRFTVRCTDQGGKGYSNTATFFIIARDPRRLWHHESK